MGNQDFGIYIGVGFFFLFGLIVLLVIDAARRQNLREQDLMALATRRGLTYLPNGMQLKSDTRGWFRSRKEDAPIAEFSDFFPLFKTGSSPRIPRALVGKDEQGTYWYLCDFSYDEHTTTTDNRSDTRTFWYSVVVGMVPMQLPTMHLRPETGMDRFGKMLGNREMEVESEEFNRRYFIKTSDERMSLDLLHPTAIETLLRQPALEWQMNGPFAMLYLLGHISADDYEGLMGCLKQFLDKIPEYYRQDHGY
ncbi:MAG: hypothetical protein JST12_05790 [Armatimonadetes bacterium]|nr:hypothetical protein [Armatimonadota bacterium]MBS1701151.1 hypothetical protein [Armatimonadota bacterium]